MLGEVRGRFPPEVTVGCHWSSGRESDKSGFIFQLGYHELHDLGQVTSLP